MISSPLQVQLHPSSHPRAEIGDLQKIVGSFGGAVQKHLSMQVSSIHFGQVTSFVRQESLFPSQEQAQALLQKDSETTGSHFRIVPDALAAMTTLKKQSKAGRGYIIAVGEQSESDIEIVAS